MNLPDLAAGVREHRAFGRRSVKTYNSHISNAIHFACINDHGNLFIEPLDWAMLIARGGDPELDPQGEPFDAVLMQDYIDAGWQRLEPGAEGFGVLMQSLLHACARRRIALSTRDIPAIFWLAPDNADGLGSVAPGPDLEVVVAAMSRLKPVNEGKHFVRHPQTDMVLPVAAVWEAATAGEGRPVDPARALARMGLRLAFVEQGASDLAETPASMGRLPASFDASIRQVTRDELEIDPVARKAAERYWRQRDEGRLCCQGCGIDFGRAYGARGEGFIHFHNDGSTSERVPALVPVCPNCHAMIHRGEEPLTIEGVRSLIEDAIRGA